ncbi:MAG: sugar phosphate isomerase/epimerase [Bryobacteraceae bacterium]|nr:sugar phosphate isomerase/epimerase [Bryobacteraceae bacterium]
MRHVTTRRGFFGGAAALAAAAGAHGGRTAPGELRLGVASYSLRKFSRADAIGMLKELGVKYVSIKSFHLPYEAPAAELKAGSQEFRDAGVDVLSGGNIDLTKPAELRAMFEYARNSGMPMMVCAPSHATLDAVEKLVGEYDIKTAIHNHGPEDRHFPTPESVLEAVKNRDPRMGLCIDAGHTTRTGADVVEWMKRAGPRLFDVHIKDLRDLLGKDSQVAVGDGAMPIVAIFRQLRAMNYQGGVMLEYEIHADNPLPGMMKSLAYMRGVLDALAG